MSDSDLFSPVRLGDIPLANRVVMAPLTRSRAVAGQVPTPLAVDYYRQRATAGLIITEASQVSQQGQGYPDTPGIFTPEQVEGWKPVVEAVHGAGGRIVIQLWHVGRVSHPVFQPGGALPVAPSAIAANGSVYTHEGMKEYPVPRALETAEIPGIVAQYAHAASLAKEAGFDGVEVHAANGYLIDQFLRDGTNKRTDRYGGSVENRARFLLEVVEAVTGVLGGSRVGVRFSPTNAFNDIADSDPVGTFRTATEQLNRFGLAYLHVVEPVAPGHPMGIPDGVPPVAAELRRAFTGPVILNGGYDAASAAAAVAEGRADAISFGLPYISNPDLVRRLQLGAPLAPADRATFYGGGAKGYTDYPALDLAAA